MKLRFLYLLLLCSMPSASFAQSNLTWTKISSSATGFMTEVSFASKDTVFVYNGSSPTGELRSIDGGFTWAPFATPKNWYVKFLDPLNGYTFGENGNESWTNATTNAGANWGPEVNDSLGGFQAKAFLLRKDTAFIFGNGAQIARTTDGGGSWHYLQHSAFAASVYAFAFADSKHIIAVGQHLSSPATGCLCLVSSDGGLSWTQKQTSAFQDLIGVTYCGSDTAIAIGNVIQRSTDGGSTWTDVTPALGFAENWSAISSSHNNVVAVGSGGVIVYSSDAGLTWTHQASGTTQNLTSVVMYNDTVAICSGQNGTILRATGQTSSVIQSISPSDQIADVFPNPAQSQIEFNLGVALSGQPTCNIYSEAGSLLKSISLSPLSTLAEGSYIGDISSLSSGTYFYRLNGANDSHSGSFVVSRK